MQEQTSSQNAGATHSGVPQDTATASQPATQATARRSPDGNTNQGRSSARDVGRARVFFSGHSLLDNPLPEFVLAIANSRGDDLNYNQQIGIGSPIRERTKGRDPKVAGFPGYSQGKNRNGSNMNCIEELRRPRTLGRGERYDTLVITERHDILGTIEWEDTVGYLRHYHDRLIEGNPKGKTLFYHTWLDIDKSNPKPWLDHEKKALYAWECVASKVNLTLAAEGRADRVRTLPGGGALVSLVEHVINGKVRGFRGGTRAKLNLIFNDNVHMTRLGSYYMALVHYAAIFGKSPVGAVVPSGVSPEAAPDLQRIAWEYIHHYYSQPKPGEHTMEQCRRYIADNVCQSFWSLLEHPEQIQSCQARFTNVDYANNPFRWPDPKLKLLPPPPTSVASQN